MRLRTSRRVAMSALDRRLERIRELAQDAFQLLRDVRSQVLRRRYRPEEVLIFEVHQLEKLSFEAGNVLQGDFIQKTVRAGKEADDLFFHRHRDELPLF